MPTQEGGAIHDGPRCELTLAEPGYINEACGRALNYQFLIPAKGCLKPPILSPR